MPILLYPLDAPPRGPKHTPTPFTRSYSGIIINQNAASENSNDYVALSDGWYHQTFYLPSSHKRGKHSPNPRIPPLTGFQVFCGVDTGHATTAVLDWVLDRNGANGWENLAEGTSLGAAKDGNEVWFNVHLPQPIEVKETWLTSQFRFGVKGRSSTGEVHTAVSRNAQVVTIHSTNVSIVPDITDTTLQEGETYLFEFQGVPSILYIEKGSGQAYYSVQGGVNRLWYTVPNPAFLASTGSKMFSGEATAVQDSARDVSMRFRILAGTADDGTDFLGNTYRSAVVRNVVSEIDTTVSSPQFWLSKPNPSKFGVESLYFDVRDFGNPVVIDRLFLDPLTPGVYFNVYYSNDDGPEPLPIGSPQPTTERSWEDRLWTHIPQTYLAARRETYAFPAPVIAKYMKVEFSHLQARPYDPGLYQRPIQYKKHPKWVLDYFLTRVETSADPFIAQRVRVDYNAYNLAYQYYSDDLRQDPSGPPPELTSQQFLTFLQQQQQNAANVVDTDTAVRISLALQPYENHPALRASIDSVLGQYARSITELNYSTEQTPQFQAAVRDVSVLDRERIIFEKTFPVLFFYVSCRHRYMISQALFTNKQGYFAGVKELAFQRDHYTSRYDGKTYIESLGDTLNTERNDLFLTPDYTLVTYGTDG